MSLYRQFFPDEQRQYIVIGVYGFLSIIYITFGINSKYKTIKCILKCAPVFFLTSFMLLSFTKIDLGHVQGNENFQRLERALYGFLLSLLGDFYLVFDSLFVLGILGFALAQVMYIILFSGWIDMAYSLEHGDIVAAIAISLISLTVYCCILRKLTWVLVIPCALYCVLLSSMLWLAWVNGMRDSSGQSMIGAVGAGFFYISDLLLVLGKWKLLEIPYGKYIVILTYYVSQILIAFYAINKCDN